CKGNHLSINGELELASRNGSLTDGYVELPYTLVQDSTLFLLLGERTTDIWKRKLEWVAEHGGMVMGIVHPDYMSFGNGNSEPYTFPAELYRDFLLWVEREFGGSYWQALPREVAEHYRQSRVSQQVRSVPTSSARIRVQ